MSKKRLKELEDLTAELQESCIRYDEQYRLERDSLQCEQRMNQSLRWDIEKLELKIKKLEKTIIKLALDD